MPSDEAKAILDRIFENSEAKDAVKVQKPKASSAAFSQVIADAREYSKTPEFNLSSNSSGKNSPSDSNTASGSNYNDGSTSAFNKFKFAPEGGADSVSAIFAKTDGPGAGGMDPELERLFKQSALLNSVGSRGVGGGNSNNSNSNSSANQTNNSHANNSNDPIDALLSGRESNRETSSSSSSSNRPGVAFDGAHLSAAGASERNSGSYSKPENTGPSLLEEFGMSTDPSNTNSADYDWKQNIADAEAQGRGADGGGASETRCKENIVEDDINDAYTKLILRFKYLFKNFKLHSVSQTQIHNLKGYSIPQNLKAYSNSSVEARRLLSQWINVQDEAAEIAKKKGIQTSWPDGKVAGLSTNRTASQERTTSEVFESARAGIGATSSSSSSSSGNYVSASRNRASEIRSSLDTGLRSSRDALRSSRDAFTPNNLRTSTENFKNNLRSSHEKHEKRGWKTGDLGWKPSAEERENANDIGGIREFKQEFDKDHYDREHLLEEVERTKNTEEVKFPPRWSSSVFPDEELGEGGNNNAHNVGQGLQVNGTGSGSSSSSSGKFNSGGSSSSSSRAAASSIHAKSTGAKSSGKPGSQSATSSSSKIAASRDKKTSQKAGGAGAQKSGGPGPQKSSSPTATGLYIGNPTLIKNSIQNKKKAGAAEEEMKKPSIDPNDVDLKRISGATASSCLRKKETVVFKRVRDQKKMFREEDSPRAFVPGAKKMGKSGKDGQSASKLKNVILKTAEVAPDIEDDLAVAMGAIERCQSQPQGTLLTEIPSLAEERQKGSDPIHPSNRSVPKSLVDDVSFETEAKLDPRTGMEIRHKAIEEKRIEREKRQEEKREQMERERERREEVAEMEKRKKEREGIMKRQEDAMRAAQRRRKEGVDEAKKLVGNITRVPKRVRGENSNGNGNAESNRENANRENRLNREGQHSGAKATNPPFPIDRKKLQMSQIQMRESMSRERRNFEQNSVNQDAEENQGKNERASFKLNVDKMVENEQARKKDAMEQRERQVQINQAARVANKYKNGGLTNENAEMILQRYGEEISPTKKSSRTDLLQRDTKEKRVSPRAQAPHVGYASTGNGLDSGRFASKKYDPASYSSENNASNRGVITGGAFSARTERSTATEDN